jgi:hypothetical protein
LCFVEYFTSGNYKYDGLVNLTGIAIIAVLDKLTAGLIIGVDPEIKKVFGIRPGPTID